MDKSTSAASNLRSQNQTILQNEICDKGNCYTTLQRHNNENSKKIFPEKELPTAKSQFLHVQLYIHVSVSDLYIHDQSAYSASRK